MQHSALRKQALEMVDQAPEHVTTDRHGSYPRAIREMLGGDVLHQYNHYLNTLIEQDHRGIKQRYYPMRGCGKRCIGIAILQSF